ncbi:MAG TPA: sialate O-acetylesterase, partial [Beijerinckiaceae bacterium]|nr:sialate O-acetylesterase [Beijerinckiaceae bacterium]
FFDGKCYLAKDPLLGASIDRSNVLTRLGELLVERGDYQSVMLVPIAHGGTFVRDWAPAGRMFSRLQWTLERLRERKITLTHIAWQQGESEAYQQSPNADEWVRHFTAMVGAIRAAGADAPIYVAQSTICYCDANEVIRSAQRRVVDPAAGIKAGPDIDQIGRNERFDDCHLSEAGLRRAAELWYEALLR